MVDAQIPMKILSVMKELVSSKYVFLILLNIFLLIIGCLMDIFSAIIIVVPLIAPLGLHYGVDPIHLAIIFIANLELGYLTPPVGMNLFLSAYRFDKKMPEIYKSTFPFFIVLLVAVLFITYFPQLTLWLL
jgi:TRAP-type C4-dicarboxylate transport system permease large subunit